LNATDPSDVVLWEFTDPSQGTKALTGTGEKPQYLKLRVRDTMSKYRTTRDR